MINDWIEFVRREAGVGIGSRQHATTLITTSYDKEKHAVKGILQPHGVETTGWVPIGVHGAGPKYGIVIGPLAGDKDKLDGTAFEVSFENGDPNSPVARHKLSSDQDQPPQVETGEHATVSKFNHTNIWKKDGSIQVATNDKDVAGQTQNKNPLLGHSATSKQNNKTVNHQTVMDPVKKKLTIVSTDGTTTHSTVHDLTKQVHTHTSTSGNTAGTDAQQTLPILPDLPGLPNTDAGGNQTHQHKFDLAGNQLSHTATKGQVTHSTVMDTAANTFSHTSSQQGGANHSIVMDLVGKTMSMVTHGSGSHSIILDLVKGIAEKTSASHTRDATSGITDTAPTIGHNGNTSVTGNLNVSQVLSAAQGAFGSMSMGGGGGGGGGGSPQSSATGGMSVDQLIVTISTQLPIYTIAGLAAIPSPQKGMIVYVSDTVSNAAAAFNGIPTGGGAITVNRPAAYDGTNWRY